MQRWYKCGTCHFLYLWVWAPLWYVAEKDAVLRQYFSQLHDIFLLVRRSIAKKNPKSQEIWESNLSDFHMFMCMAVLPRVFEFNLCIFSLNTFFSVFASVWILTFVCLGCVHCSNMCISTELAYLIVKVKTRLACKIQQKHAFKNCFISELSGE